MLADQIRTVAVHLSAAPVDRLDYLCDSLLKETKGVGVRDHEAGS